MKLQMKFFSCLYSWQGWQHIKVQLKVSLACGFWWQFRNKRSNGCLKLCLELHGSGIKKIWRLLSVIFPGPAVKIWCSYKQFKPSIATVKFLMCPKLWTEEWGVNIHKHRQLPVCTGSLYMSWSADTELAHGLQNVLDFTPKWVLFDCRPYSCGS